MKLMNERKFPFLMILYIFFFILVWKSWSYRTYNDIYLWMTVITLFQNLTLLYNCHYKWWHCLCYYLLGIIALTHCILHWSLRRILKLFCHYCIHLSKNYIVGLSKWLHLTPSVYTLCIKQYKTPTFNQFFLLGCHLCSVISEVGPH